MIKTQNRNNIIFKIDYLGPEETMLRNKGNLEVRNNPSKLFQIKHAFSQTMITFNSQVDKFKNKKDSSSSTYN